MKLMKKRFVSLVASLACLSAVSAQVTQSYDPVVKNGTYTPITGGTVVTPKADSLAFGDGYYVKGDSVYTSKFTDQGYPIGFDFKFNNKLMNQFAIAAHGFIVLGKDSVSSTAADPFQILISQADDNLVGMFYRSAVGRIPTTEISYQTTGTAPNRELVVQFKDLQLCVKGWSKTEVRDTVQLQIRLHEGSGQIDMVFNGFEPSAAVASNLNYNDAFKIGIRGDYGDLLTKDGSFDSDLFVVKDASIRWKSNQFPTDGLTYQFNAPEDCAAPSAQPTDLKLASTTLGVSGEFKKVDVADHYLVLLNKTAELATLPEAGKIYEAGDSIGDARVLAYSEDSVFTSGDVLEGASSYYVHVIGANSFCFYGPKYNTTSPLTSAVGTKPLAPSSMAFADRDTTTVTLNVAADAAGNDVLVAYTAEQNMNDWGETILGGKFGTPEGAYKAGDAITGGGTVAYVGKAKDGITVADLTPGKLYHFSVWSRNAAGDYSSLTVEKAAVTATTLPWKLNLSDYTLYSAPEGWDAAGNWAIEEDADGNRQITGRIDNVDTKGNVAYLETPDLYLAEGTNRIGFDLLMYNWARFGNTPYVLADNDTIAVQVTTDGVTYTDAATYTKENPIEYASADEALTIRVPFTEAAGKKARIRLYMRICGNPTTVLNNIYVEEKKSCDYPVDVTVEDSTIVGSEATVTWTPQGEEDAWDVRYKKADDAEWGTPVTVREKKYTMTGLDGLTSYDVQVRARCSAASQSEWSSTETFTSGLAIPFDMVFAEQSSLSSAWLIKSGAMGSDLTDGENWSFRNSFWSKGLLYNAYDEKLDDWLFTPVLDLGDENLNYNVKVAISATGDSIEGSDGTLQLVVVKDGEKPSKDNVVYTITQSDMPEAYGPSKTFTVPVKGYNGKARIALYTHSTVGGWPTMKLDTLGVDYTCVNDIEAKVDSVGEDTIRMSFTTGAEEVYVFVREAGQTTRDFAICDETSIALGGLKPHTTYEIGLTKACEVGDTAKVKIVEVTTLGSLCAEPVGVKATPSKYSAKIEWAGEASAYNVRYRAKGDTPTEWTTEQVRDTFIVISGLENNAEYEYAIQAQCSKLASDTSAYTPVATFTTLVETCQTPTNVAVAPSYNKATVSFESEADKFEVSYRKASEEAWTSSVKASTSADNKHSIDIEGLVAETAYKVRLRAICAEGDSSRWTASTDFTTQVEPECVTPTDLTVSDLTENSATLSWTADASNLTWNLRYRESTVQEWTEETALTETTYNLTDLKANTAYIWRVQATCEAERVSKWAAQNKFTTATATGIDNIGIGSIGVFVKGNVLNVTNPEGGVIKSIAIYTADGRTVAVSEVNSAENVFMPLSVHGPVIIKVNGQKQSKTLRAVIK